MWEDPEPLGVQRWALAHLRQVACSAAGSVSWEGISHREAEAGHPCVRLSLCPSGPPLLQPHLWPGGF